MSRAEIAETVAKPFPVLVKGEVVAGFGRGGKQLGIPTANLATEAVERALENMDIGVYLGWAQVEGGAVMPMVMSLGWNPYFKNEKRSGEVHIMHAFKDDFYGKTLRIAVLAFVRPERDYASLDALVADIREDIRIAHEALEQPDYAQIKQSPFFGS
ncbi:riboflavin kinase [Coemansia nantahalensis]|uniref:Riboflavin kinase n=2 Tax=Coemansia TaxID=4863 RepID=A0ACC1LAD0_9FUNG|nr:riboflavin kinase [Coemansia nantahalensis]KAJ2768865.1 riboflavin kinase [Coemansia nantahalensis]KAJ2804608.1 riboflavin kinase [Coemansia helicoidea]